MLSAAQAGAAWAFSELYEDLAPVVGGYLRIQGLRDHEDVTSEVFISVFKNVGRFSGDEAAFRSWVFTIAHHRLVDERRRLGRRPDADPLEDGAGEPEGGDVEEEALAELGGVWVAEALAELTDEQRQVVTLRILGGLSVEQTAEVMGRRPGAVRALQHRALQRLRRSLGRGRVFLPEGDRRG